MADSQELGGIHVTIGADLGPLKSKVAEAKQIVASAEQQLKIGGNSAPGAMGPGSVNRGDLFSGAKQQLARLEQSTGELRATSPSTGSGVLGGGFGLGAATRTAMQVAAIGYGGRLLNSATSEIRSTMGGFADNGRIIPYSGGEKAERILGDIPVFGSYWQAGRNIQGMITGTPTDEMDQAVQNQRLGIAENKAKAGRSVKNRIDAMRGGVMAGIDNELQALGDQLGPSGNGMLAVYGNLRRTEVATQDRNDRAADANASKNRVESTTASAIRASRGAEIAGIEGSAGGIYGSLESRKSVNELQYKNRLSSINGEAASSKLGVNERANDQVEAAHQKWGRGSESANNRILEIDRARLAELGAIEKSTAAAIGEASARRTAADAQFENANAVRGQDLSTSLSTRRNVASARGQGMTHLAGVQGTIGAIRQEQQAALRDASLTAMQKMDILGTGKAELQAIEKNIMRPNRYATESSRGTEAPGGPGGNAGREMIMLLQAIRDAINGVPQTIS